MHWLLSSVALIAGFAALDATAETPSLEESVVYEAGQGGYANYRIPAVITTASGTVLAFAEGRKDSLSDAGNIDLLLRRSEDHGRTWEPVQVVVDDGGDTCGNPAPVLDKTTDTIWLVFTKNKGDTHEGAILRGDAPPRTVWVTHSTDDGLTWATPKDISATTREPDWRWYATGPCHGIQLDDGTLMIPCDHSLSPDNKNWFSHVIYSGDHGETWQLGGTAGPYCNESNVAQLADGRLYLNMRSYKGNASRQSAFSSDKGMTWSAPEEDATLVEPVCQGSVLRIADDEAGSSRLLFSNPASTKRENLTIRLSFDESRSWPVSRTLHTGPAAYSDLVALDAHTIGCLYEKGETTPYETIAFARIPLGWLTAGAAADE